MPRDEFTLRGGTLHASIAIAPPSVVDRKRLAPLNWSPFPLPGNRVGFTFADERDGRDFMSIENFTERALGRLNGVPALHGLEDLWPIPRTPSPNSAPVPARCAGATE